MPADLRDWLPQYLAFPCDTSQITLRMPALRNRKHPANEKATDWHIRVVNQRKKVAQQLAQYNKQAIACFRLWHIATERVFSKPPPPSNELHASKVETQLIDPSNFKLNVLAAH